MPLVDALEVLPPLQLWLATIACGALVAAAVLGAVHVTLRLLRVGPADVIAVRDSLITSLSAMFALMVAFSAAGIWNDSISARGAVQREANALENAFAMAARFTPKLKEEVREEILEIGRRSVESDWPAMERWAGPNEALLDRSEGPVVKLITLIADEASLAPVSGSNLMLAQLIELRSARLQREMIARGGVSAAQWTAMIVIPLAALILIAVGYNHDPRLRVGMMSIYTVAVCSALFVVLAHERPFAGYLRVLPTPLVEAMRRIEKAPQSRADVPVTMPRAFARTD